MRVFNFRYLPTIMIPIKQRNIISEVIFTATRSRGPGGQNVNKVNSQVQLRFNIINSEMLTKNEKSVLLYKLKHQLTKNGDLIITAQTERSQLQNKKLALDKLQAVLEKVLKPQKTRIATRPTKRSNVRRLEQKRRHGEQKILRRKLY